MNCIFCTDPITDENRSLEHVFPDTVGGAFILLNVCAVCNNILGENIDNPFTRHDAVLWYRNLFKISRSDPRSRNRSIPNPLKGKPKPKDEQGNEYYLQFEDGKPRANIVPQYEPPEFSGDGFFGKITIPLKDFVSEEGLVKQYAKKYGIPYEKITQVMSEKQIESPKSVTVQLTSDSTVFILGALKIAYEYVATFVPEYIEDSLAREFVEILLSKNLEGKEQLFDGDPSIQDISKARVESIENLQVYHHVIQFFTVQGKGLICAVRVFNWIYGIRMSHREDYLIGEGLTLVNDALQRAWSVNIKTQLETFSITVETAGFTSAQRTEFEYHKASGLAKFKTPTGKFPIYDRFGILLHKHIDGLLTGVNMDGRHYNHSKKEIEIELNLQKNKYFIKSKKKQILFPLLKVKFIQRIKY